MRFVVIAVLSFVIAACSNPDVSDPSTPLTTSLAEPFAVLEALEHDCLQYPVGTNSEGDMLWHADFVFFYLLDEHTQDLYFAEDGNPLARGLLFHEVIALMEQQPEIPGTVWTYRVQRVVQYVRDGHVVRNDPYVTIDDADVWELLEKDRAARGEEGVSLPETQRPTS